MECTYTNEKLNNIIRDCLPEEIKIVPYLMDLLCLSRESVYRRLRGEVSYNMQEVAVLASSLKFSLEEVFDNKGKVYFSLDISDASTPTEDYVRMMKKTIKVFSNIKDEQNVKAYYVGNKTPNNIFLNYTMLAKLLYVRWIHQTHNLAIDSKFSDIIVPSQVAEVHKEYVDLSKKINQFTAIIDDNIILAIINTIKFYSRRNLFVEKEILEMKRELLMLVDRFEYISRTGKDMYNTDNYLYLSSLNVESNIMLFEFEKGMITQFLSTGRLPFVTTNFEVCKEQRMWIDALLKSSVLMTRSNEILQAEFVKRQRDLVESQFNLLLTKYYS